jgi:hypothetical protein
VLNTASETPIYGWKIILTIKSILALEKIVLHCVK